MLKKEKERVTSVKIWKKKLFMKEYFKIGYQMVGYREWSCNEKKKLKQSDKSVFSTKNVCGNKLDKVMIFLCVKKKLLKWVCFSHFPNFLCMSYSSNFLYIYILLLLFYIYYISDKFSPPKMHQIWMHQHLDGSLANDDFFIW